MVREFEVRLRLRLKPPRRVEPSPVLAPRAPDVSSALSVVASRFWPNENEGIESATVVSVQDCGEVPDGK